jgi:hypothetical protein
MKTSIRIAAMVVAAAACLSNAWATDFIKPRKNAEISLLDGNNDVVANGMTLRVIKAYVSTLTAHSYLTLTSFVLPAETNRVWRHVLVDQPDRDFPDFRTVESADSTVQAVAMYRDRGAIYVIEATKEGLAPPDLYLKAARVMFRIYRFNASTDVARFEQESVLQSVSMYVDANDALANEFFTK